jgi:thioredoxin 1
MIEPAMEKLDREYKGKVEILKINADENLDLLQALRISGIPTLLAYNGDQEITRTTGAQSLKSLERLFEAAATGSAPIRKKGLSVTDRMIRALVGIAFLGLIWANGFSFLWLALAGIFLFSAVYDRCPIWKALTSRVSQLVEQRK